MSHNQDRGKRGEMKKPFENLKAAATWALIHVSAFREFSTVVKATRAPFTNEHESWIITPAIAGEWLRLTDYGRK